jgi:hypothetical protein
VQELAARSVPTILDHLKMTSMISFECSKGHCAGFTDLIYLDVGHSNAPRPGVPTPAAVTAAGIHRKQFCCGSLKLVL